MSGAGTRTASALAYLRAHGVKIGLELLVNFLLPYLIYDLGKARLGDVGALMASSIPPILWSIVEFIRERKLDAVSMLVLAGIVLGLAAFVGGGGVKFLQLRENLVTGLVGLVFVGSAAIGRPLIYQLARAGMRRNTPDKVAAFEQLSDNIHFRRAMTVMTLVWGLGLLASCALSCALVFAMSIKQYLLVSSPVSYATMGLLAAWTIWYVRRSRRRRQESPAPATSGGEPSA